MAAPRRSKSEARQQRKEAKGKVTERQPLVARNAVQAEYLRALRTAEQVFGIGPAGTGKTYIVARWAIRQVLDGQRDRVILSRPTVAKRRHELGFLPGGDRQKLDPWLVPIIDAFKDECSPAVVEKLIGSGHIQFVAFQHMRGRTFRDAVVLLDEAQNCDADDLRLFLTRTGGGTQVLVNGDTDQTDIPDSGLARVVDLIARRDLSATVVRFGPGDVTRSAIAREWVEAFAQERKVPNEGN